MQDLQREKYNVPVACRNKYTEEAKKKIGGTFEVATRRRGRRTPYKPLSYSNEVFFLCYEYQSNTLTNMPPQKDSEINFTFDCTKRNSF